MFIPGISEVVATGNIDSHLKEKYRSLTGVTATMGNECVRNKIKESINANLSVEIPRAIRPLGNEANWPLKGGKPVYNRLYRFPPIYENSESTHFAKLLEAIQNIQDNDQSCILFWNTIEECNDFLNYLKDNKINTGNVQILDDTSDEDDASAGKSFRPPEAAVITRAKEPRMITLTTAAGSRGTDFDDINVGILAKPNLGRVTLQKAGRIARNGQFGQVYEIYNTQDLIQLDTKNKNNTQKNNKKADKQPIDLHYPHRSHIFKHEEELEKRTLNAINQLEERSKNNMMVR